MPPVSEAQRRWAYWTLKHGSKKQKKVAKDFIGSGVTGLPERVEDGEAVKKSTTHSPFSALLEQLHKAEYFKRVVQFIGGTNPKPQHLVSDANLNSTLRPDGRLARIKVGAVKMDKVPEGKRGKLRRVVTDVTDQRKVGRDTPTEHYTMMRDGSIQKIQMFAKSQAFRALLQRLQSR